MNQNNAGNGDLLRSARRNSACVVSYGILLLLLAAHVARAETPLIVRDPNASFLDVQARRKALQNVQTPSQTSRLLEALASPKSCTGAPIPAPPPKGQDIPSRYRSSSHGELNPQEHTLSEPYYNVQDVAAWGANRYLVTGDPLEAACVIHALLPWAQSKALLNYNAKDDMVVWFQSTWTVASLSLSVSVIRAEPALNPAERDQVIAWLRAAAQKAVSESRGPSSGTERNNHFFWRGLAATAAGVISKDDNLFAAGLRTYATAIGEIDSRGAFPLEMERHELALHYQAFAIEPLVMIAELARRQGIDIYGVEENKHRLRDAVVFLSKAMADPTLVKKYASETQQIAPDLEAGSQLLAWVEFWNLRFADPSWQGVLQKPFYAARLGGNTTLYVAPVDEKAPQAPATQTVK
ncbi:MAG: alginate lyase family protein [Terracidiphilus sp.]